MADAPSTNQPSSPKKGGYGKRPLWQWIVLYLIIAIVVYGGIFYYLRHRNSSSSNGGTTNTSIY